MSKRNAETVRLTEAEKRARIVRSQVPVEDRVEKIRQAIQRFNDALTRVCAGCHEFPEFCICEDGAP